MDEQRRNFLVSFFRWLADELEAGRCDHDAIQPIIDMIVSAINPIVSADSVAKLFDVKKENYQAKKSKMQFASTKLSGVRLQDLLKWFYPPKK